MADEQKSFDLRNLAPKPDFNAHVRDSQPRPQTVAQEEQNTKFRIDPQVAHAVAAAKDGMKGCSLDAGVQSDDGNATMCLKGVAQIKGKLRF